MEEDTGNGSSFFYLGPQYGMRYERVPTGVWEEGLMTIFVVD